MTKGDHTYRGPYEKQTGLIRQHLPPARGNCRRFDGGDIRAARTENAEISSEGIPISPAPEHKGPSAKQQDLGDAPASRIRAAAIVPATGPFEARKSAAGTQPTDRLRLLSE